MKFSKIALSGLLITAAITFQNCSSDDDNNDNNTPPPAMKGDMEIKFDHRWGPSQAPFTLDNPHTHPATGEEITFTTLRYYISNVRLHKSDGSTHAEEESYHIVDASATFPKVHVKDIPAGDYTGVSFLIGVDSLRNVSGAQTGALDPAENMFWSWSTGYIFIKAEGSSPAAMNETFTYHLGGFSGEHSALREVYSSFGDADMRIAPDALPSAHFMVNAARFWHGGISLGEMSMVHMPGANASQLATNFSGGFILDHIHN